MAGTDCLRGRNGPTIIATMFGSMPRALVLATLLLSFAASHVLAADPAATAAAERRRIEQIVREYLLTNPEILTEAMGALKAKQERQSLDRVREVVASRKSEIYGDSSAPVAGNPRGNVTIVEFVDLRCPVCRRFNPITRQLVAEDRNIRRIYKVWPILGPESVFAARMALAAHAQGGFDRFFEAMMTHAGKTGPDEINEVARGAGLDLARLRSDMSKPEIDAALGRNFALADALGINGTPSFLVGDVLVRGGRELDELKAIVAQVRGK